MAFQFSSVDIPFGISKTDWYNWKWQIRKSLKTQKDYEQYFSLTSEEKQGFKKTGFAVQTTPFYAQLARSQKSSIRKIIVPVSQESQPGTQALKDPLGEEVHSPEKHVIHRYPDRVVFLVTDFCPIYCRYCTRKRFTSGGFSLIRNEEYERAIKYIRSNKGVREVILSGGDPLTLTDSILERILKDLRKIMHIEIIRIGSRMPAVCPMRISYDFTEMIKKYHPVFIMSHFNHPSEITQETAKALNILADGGIPVFNQMVLINSVNNHPCVVQALCRRLLFLRARPYYMFQCDPSLGTDHLRTSVENSKWIQKQLWGTLSGLAMPRLALDLPEGGGKVEIVPDSLVKSDDLSHTFRGWDGMVSAYKEPRKGTVQYPSDIELYSDEWNALNEQSYGRHGKQQRDSYKK